MARRIGIINNKGGVAKSTTAVNLALGIAMKGHRVLLVDSDPAGGASQYLGLVAEVAADNSGEGRLYTTADWLAGDDFDPRRDHLRTGFDFLPASLRLSFLESKLYSAGPEGNRRMASAMAAIDKNYDYILIDSLPHLGVLMANVAIAAPRIIIPVKMDQGGVPQTLALFDYLTGLRQTWQPELSIAGVVATFFEERAATPKELYPKLKELFGDRLLTTIIHTSRAVEGANGLGVPIVLANPKDRGAQEYIRLTEEVLNRG